MKQAGSVQLNGWPSPQKEGKPPIQRSQDRPLATSSSNPSRRMAFWRKTNFCTLPLAVKGYSSSVVLLSRLPD